MLCFLLKLDNAEQIKLSDFKGALFENMMIAEYVKRMHHCNQLNDIWFWRDVAGNEVDLIIQAGPTQKAIEFKATQTIMPNLFKGLNYYEKISEKIDLSKYLVYGGEESQKRTVATVVPWRDFGGKMI